ncbi:MAG: glycosyltransferase [Candidatus Dormibacteraeota bacterium]|nr:glycosyltransferase [Candidatus Dormibacteraeota bacterium]
MIRNAFGPVAVISMHASPLGALGRGENGGGNLSVRRLCEGLAESGIPTDVYVRRDDAAVPAEEMIAPMSRLVRLPVGPPRPIPKQNLVALVDEFSAAVIAHAASERRSYVVVHGHYWLGGLVARQLRDAWHVPWVQSFHTLARAKARVGLPLDGARAVAEASLVAAADRLVTGSVAEAKDLMRLYGASRNSICVAQPGVDLRVLHPRDTAALRAELGLDGHRVLLFAGRLEPLKGADTLLGAVARLGEDERFDDVVTLVIGEDSGDGAAAGGERRRLEAVAGDSGLEARVSFLGAVEHEDLADYYALADICVVPSRTETFGLVALEAQALGTPVVASAVGGLTEIVEDGVTGILVADRQPRAFASAIASLLDDADLRLRMGEAARVRAATFTWARAVERLAAIYRRVTRTGVSAATPCGYTDNEVMAVAG